MSEFLTLAEKFKQKSDKTAESIESELQSVMTKLNDSMTAKLKESENIIKTGTADLKKQNEQLQLKLKETQDSIDSQVQTHINNNQTRTQQAITGSIKQTNKMIESHTASVQTLLKNRQNEITQALKSHLSKWVVIAGIALLVTFILGLLVGASMTKPQAYRYYHDTKSGQTYMLPLKD